MIMGMYFEMFSSNSFLCLFKKFRPILKAVLDVATSGVSYAPLFFCFLFYSTGDYLFTLFTERFLLATKSSWPQGMFFSPQSRALKGDTE